MNPLATTFFLLNAAALFLLPRRWAPVPLLAGAAYMTNAQGLDFGILNFSVLRLLVLCGGLRILLRRERPAGVLNALDWLMLAWGTWAVISCSFHEASVLVTRLGTVYDILGIYFLIRCFCTSASDVMGVARILALLLIPVALEMVNEQITGRNFFALFGGVAESPEVREGRLRAQGPFSHAILAGTVGAITAPILVGLWRGHPRIALAGLVGCGLMVFTSASSGPIMSLLAAAFALIVWRYRHLTGRLRAAAVVGYLLLDLVMKAPAYFLIARIDLAGGSTGWHRAALIQAAIEHLGDWWFAGTDHTRHWMPTGVGWNENHTDITNYYLEMGVSGGLPLMLLYMAALWKCFQYVGQAVRSHTDDSFFFWCLGASLFASAVTGVSVPFFGQSFVFLYLVIAAINSSHAANQAISETVVISDDSESQDILSIGSRPNSQSIEEKSVPCCCPNQAAMQKVG